MSVKTCAKRGANIAKTGPTGVTIIAGRGWDDRRAYQGPRFQAPFGYTPYRIGSFAPRPHYGARYWIDNPRHFALPYAAPGLKWVRHYDDALLVNMRTGQVPPHCPPRLLKDRQPPPPDQIRGWGAACGNEGSLQADAASPQRSRVGKPTVIMLIGGFRRGILDKIHCPNLHAGPAFA
jgi:hypothetical protein